MTTFIDGPAKGQTLMLRHCVVFLRVVSSGGLFPEKWDALDQPGDTPERDETLHAYILNSTSGTAHINMGGGRGGFYTMAQYRYLETQPPDSIMRDSVKWREWCEANKHLYVEK